MPAQFIGFDNNNIYSNPEGVVVGIKGTETRLKIFFDTGGDNPSPYDPFEIEVTVYDENESVVISGSKSGGLIEQETTGIFYIPSKSVTFNYDLLASAPKDYTLTWSWQDGIGSPKNFITSKFIVIPLNVYSWFPRLRNILDKSGKLIGSARIGYTDANLYYYLQGGLDEINIFPPVTSFYLHNFPIKYGELLIDSASVVALLSQSLFAVDTDTMTFSDQGFSFTTDHFSRLNTVMNQLLGKIKDNLSRFKMEFSNVASVQVQMVPYYPMAVLLKTAPRGGLFRNLFVSL